MGAELSERLSEERLRAFSETRGLLAVMARELLELRAELKRAQADRDGHLEAFGRIKRYQLSAEAEVERLREALRRYGRHDGQVCGGPTCDYLSDWPARRAGALPCTCGLSAALKDSEEGR